MLTAKIKSLRNASMAVAFSLAIVPQTSAETPMLLDSPAAAVAVGALMEPIVPLLSSGPGSTTSITQLGEGSFASSSITGSGSLSLIQQGGTNNRAIQSIEGNSSALLLVQGGRNNSVVQASRGNNNFQLVGVSGENNNVGYLQMGDNLQGALDVTNARNTDVLAIQTPHSAQYLMPTGLRGLRNASVVIVPGRMYVLRK